MSSGVVVEVRGRFYIAALFPSGVLLVDDVGQVAPDAVQRRGCEALAERYMLIEAREAERKRVRRKRG